MIGDIIRLRPSVCLVGAVAAFGLAGCQREQIRVYRVPKEDRPPSSPMMSAQENPHGGGAPRLVWKAPPGWEETPAGELRLASFKVKSPDGRQQADVSVIPLSGSAGGDLANVNRWRGQVGLAPVNESELAQQAETVAISGQPARLYDLAGQHPSANEPSRILAAILHREGTAWFFKMSGDAALVAQQKPAFVEFLKSVQFHAPGDAPAQVELPAGHPPIESGGGPAGAAATPKPRWQVPSGWQEEPPGPMQTAKFLVSGAGEARAEATVAVIPGDGGGTLANVNRWRKQIGLGPIDAADLEQQTSVLDVGGRQVRVLDVTSADKTKRLLAVGVPRSESTWFYKLLGDEAVVAREKAAFLQFVQSAP